MANSVPRAIAAIATFALVTVALPGPIMIDLLGAGLATIGLGMIYEGR